MHQQDLATEAASPPRDLLTEEDTGAMLNSAEKGQGVNTENKKEKLREKQTEKEEEEDDDDETVHKKVSKKKRKKKHRHRKHGSRRHEHEDVGDHGTENGDIENEDINLMENKTFYHLHLQTDKVRKDGRSPCLSESSPDPSRPSDVKNEKRSESEQQSDDDRKVQHKEGSAFDSNSDPQKHDHQHKRKRNHSEQHHKKSKKKHHKKHKRHHNNDNDDADYVSDRLHSLLGVSRDKKDNKSNHSHGNGDNNIQQLNQNLKDYVKEVGVSKHSSRSTGENLIEDGGSLKTQAEIIFELLAVEKAILRQHKKKELHALKRKSEQLEEMRRKRKKVGTENYKEFDNQLHEISRKIVKCKKSIKKEKSESAKN